MNIFHRRSDICNNHFVDLFNDIDVLSTFSLTIFAGHALICIGICIVFIHGISIMRVSSQALKFGYINIVTFQLCIWMLF
ncbi:MAG: hypothetical protein WCG25_07555 [bacterium]